jgi:transposase-like protein
MSEVTSEESGSRRWSAPEWAHWVDLFERSGQKLKAFCREQGLAPSTFSYWRRRLREVAGADGGKKFVEVRMARRAAAGVPWESAASGLMRIGVPGGIWMEVREGTDASWLAGVVRALAPSAE